MEHGESSFEDLLVTNLGLIERIVRALCRRHGIAGDDYEEFASRVNAKLIEDDYAVLRKFRRESSLATYLMVVIAMLLRDFRVQRWGRWRPSAEARRNGPVAIRLETLVYRDSFTWRQAIESIRLSGDASMTERELMQLFEKLPRRLHPRPREVEIDAIPNIASAGTADDDLGRTAVEAEQRELDHALTTAIAGLKPEDGIILRMRYWDGLSVAQIARALNQPQKRLYRRVERALVQLRRRLQALGVSRERVASLFHENSSYS